MNRKKLVRTEIRKYPCGGMGTFLFQFLREFQRLPPLKLSIHGQSMFLGLSYMIIGEKIFEIFSPMNEREFVKFV